MDAAGEQLGTSGPMALALSHGQHLRMRQDMGMGFKDAKVAALRFTAAKIRRVFSAHGN